MARTKYSFWAGRAVEEQYIVKQRKGNEKLTAINAIHDHLSNSIYKIFGVTTPDLYIGRYREELSLISRILPGYKDLIDWFKGENILAEINKQDDVAACVATYKKFENLLTIRGKESLLAAAIILEDPDVIGAGFRNLGLIESMGHYTIIKIDPSDSLFSTSPENATNILDEFERSLSLDNPLILSTFSFSKLFNNPHSILGNLHFNEFFNDIDKDKLKLELAKFANLNDESLKKLVIREEYLELLPLDNKRLYLEHLANLLLRKKAIIKKVLNTPDLQAKLPELPLPPVAMKDLVLSDSSETIEYGASKPLKVKRIFPTPKIMPLEAESVTLI